MNKKIEYLITLIGLFISLSDICYAQDWKTDLLAMNKTYLNAQSFSMDVLVESYQNASDTKPVISYKGKVAKKDENYFTFMTGKTTVINKRCVLVIDDGQKMVLYKENNSTKNKGSDFFTLANLDSAMILMTKETDVTYSAISPIESSIQIAYKGNSGSKQEIIINKATNTLSRIIYYSQNMDGNVKTSTKVVVKYSNIKLDESIPDDFFSEKKYITKKLGLISLSRNYSNYQLVNESPNIRP